MLSLWIRSTFAQKIVLSLIGLSQFSGSAFAQESYTQKIKVIDALSENAELKCPADLPIHDHVVVMFDGLTGFCPKKASLKIPQWSNPNQEALSDEILVASSRKSKNDSALQADLDEAYRKMSGLRKNENTFFHQCYLIDAVSNFLDSPQVSILYYSHRGVNQAAACITSLQKKAEVQNRNLKFSLLGYSLGGDAANRVAKKINIQHIATEAIVTIDPVGRWFRALNSTVLHQNNTPFFRKPNYVKTWTNFYQTEDKDALFLFGIRGNRVQGADDNIEIKITDTNITTDDLIMTIGTPHATILYSRQLQDKLNQLFEVADGEQTP